MQLLNTKNTSVNQCQKIIRNDNGKEIQLQFNSIQNLTAF